MFIRPSLVKNPLSPVLLSGQRGGDETRELSQGSFQHTRGPVHRPASSATQTRTTRVSTAKVCPEFKGPVAFRGPFPHPAHPQWTNSGAPKFLFASATEQTQTLEYATEPENDDLETQAQSEQPPASRRRSRSLVSSLGQRSVTANRVMLARFLLAAIPIIALSYGCYKFFEEEDETAGDKREAPLDNEVEEESYNEKVVVAGVKRYRSSGQNSGQKESGSCCWRCPGCCDSRHNSNAQAREKACGIVNGRFFGGCAR
ncbi:UNVERIFIED_CONTAM: hypothetical protein HHA_314570 [Hammondia hammondi]|eukprot:XP_008883475.1 hypothetical protein HHA_314570 [Hammondia hammondi]